MGRNGIFRNVRRIQPARLHFFRYFFHTVNQFHTAAVINGHIQYHPIIGGGIPFTGCDFFSEPFRKDRHISNNMDLYIICHQLTELADKIIFKKFHEETDFQGRAFPVFGRKGIECENFDSHMSGSPDNGFHIGRPFLVSEGSFPSPLPGPPAIAIEDDSYMFGKRFFI